MSLKVKLTSTICAFLLILGLVITGVFAVPQATVNLGGTLTFKASDVYARVTGTITGSKEDPTLTPIEFNAGSASDTSTWTNNLAFKDDGSEITITINVENLATDRDLYVSVNDNVETNSNLTKFMKKGDDLYSGELVKIEKETSANFTMKIRIKDKNASLSDASYGYLINLEDSSSLKTNSDYLAEQGIVFNFNEENFTASVLADFDNQNYKFNDLLKDADVIIPSYVKKGDVIYKVTEIATCGFSQYYPDSVCRAAQINSIVIPSTVNTIKREAFYNSSTLNKMTIYSTSLTVENIFNAESPAVLELLKFNKELVDMVANWGSELIIHSGDVDFSSNYHSYKKVVFGEGVTSIVNGFEAGGTQLVEIVVEALTPPTITSGKTSLFPNAPESLVVKVPSSSLSLYQADENWSTFNLQGV